MSRETNYLLRLSSQATKEIKATALVVTNTSAAFVSELTEGYKRKGLYAYNNSNSASGECYWGASDVTPLTGQLIPKGSQVEIPVTTDLDVHFVASAGEIGDFRMLEIA